jgi:hypothetical protein
VPLGFELPRATSDLSPEPVPTPETANNVASTGSGTITLLRGACGVSEVAELLGRVVVELEDVRRKLGAVSCTGFLQHVRDMSLHGFA